MSHFDEIATFVHVVETGGISAAARRMRLPKSTISRRLGRLEEALGVRLMQRTTRQLQLTDAGRELFDQSADAVTRLEDATRRAREHQDTIEGRIRITAPNDYGQQMIAPIVAEFVRRHPAVDVEVELTARVVNLITEGFDLAIRAGKLPDSTLVGRRLQGDVIGFFASPAYLDRAGRPEHPSELSSHECVRFMAFAGGDRWSLQRDKEVVSVEVKGHIKANDVTFVRECVLADGGVAMLPSSLMAAQVKSGAAEAILPGWTLAGANQGVVDLHLVYPTARQLPARVRALRDLILERLRWSAN